MRPENAGTADMGQVAAFGGQPDGLPRYDWSERGSSSTCVQHVVAVPLETSHPDQDPEWRPTLIGPLDSRKRDEAREQLLCCGCWSPTQNFFLAIQAICLRAHL